MFCTECGAQVADGARFCTKCGAAVTPNEPSDPGPNGGADGISTPSGGPASSADVPPARPDEPPATQPSATEEAQAAARPPETEGAQAAARPPETQGEPSAAQPPALRIKDRKPALIAACVVLVLAVGIAGFAALLNGANGEATNVVTELLYGSDEVATVSRKARLLPLDGDGEPIAHYWVRLLRGVDEDGDDIDLSGTEAFEVSSTDGFAIGDVLADLPDGTYYPVILEEEDGEARPLPPVGVGDGEDADDGTITVKPDAERKLGADALFLAKLETLQAQYGGPSIGVKRMTESDMYFSMLEGLSYAELLDFGDGVERLALAYRADWLLDDWTVQGDWAHAYVFEVWQYDADTDSISKVPSYDGNPMEVSTRGWQGFSEVLSPVRQAPSGDRLVAIDTVYPLDVDNFEPADADYVPLAMSGRSYYGLNEEGDFGHLVTLESTEGPGEPNPVYQIDGEAVSEEEYAHVEADLITDDESAEPTPAFSRASDQVTEEQAKSGDVESLLRDGIPADTKQLTLDTIEELRSRVEAPASKDGDEGTKGKDALTETVSVQAVPVSQKVTIPDYGYDLSNPKSHETEWNYISFDPVDASKGVAKINAALEERFNAEKTAAVGWSMDSPADGECVAYRSGCTYSDGTYAAVRIERRRTLWGPHGWTEMDGFVFDLKTGEEVAPWDAVGVTQEELEEMAVDAIVTYVQAHPGSSLSSTEEVAAEAREMVAAGSATLLLTDKGVTVYLPHYSMGYSYADGDMEILVMPLGGDWSAGISVRDGYRLITGGSIA